MTDHTASPKHLIAWMNERFPPSHGVLFLIMYVTALLFGQFVAGAGALSVSVQGLIGFAGAWSFFLMLRVFDEHKDYDLDLLNHPERVLQSGKVTLGHLKVLGAGAIATQAVVSLWFDGWTVGPVTQCWAVVIVWSSLMAKEFFVGEWLEKRLVLYALSHMVVMPMALVWMATMGAGRIEAADFALLAALSFLSGAAFEVTRKTKGPEEERDTIQSYSQVWGARGAAAIVAVLLVGQAAVEVLLLKTIAIAHWGWYAGLAATFVLPATALAKYVQAPSTKGREANEGGVSMAMLGAYVLLLAAMIAVRSIVWTG